MLSGKTSAKIAVKNTKMASMFWPMHAKKGERFDFSFQTRASQKTTLTVAFESVSGDQVLFEQDIQVREGKKVVNFQTETVRANRQYRFAFYIKNSEPGTEVWLDNIELETADE